MKKYLILILTLLLCVSLFSCDFNFNEEFIFGEPEVPTAPPQPPISKMEPDVMMHVLNEKGVVFENYDPITEQKIVQMMLTILENDPGADINIPEKYSKQFEQMRGIVRERGTTSTKGFELTTMSDDALFNHVDDYLRPIYEKYDYEFSKDDIFGIRRAMFCYEKDINHYEAYGHSFLVELQDAYCQIVKDYHGIE
jgi:hypothetical protein